MAEASRREWATVLGATARLTRDLALAEECTSDAFLRALETWPRDGVPDRPGAWLTATARRRAVDLLRREAVLRRKLPLLLEPDDGSADDADDGNDVLPDDRLRLVFTCCHPVLSREAQVALTLRLVCGLTTVVHLLVTAGHTAPGGGTLLRADLLARALHLARVLAALLPDEPEVRGLLALCLLVDGRREARVDGEGLPVLLAEQDRSRWDAAAVAEGRALARSALAEAPTGRFCLQAALAAAHLRGPEPDLEELVRQHARLLAVWDSPAVALDAAVTLGLARGPRVGLAALDRLAADAVLRRSHYLPAARGELLLRAGAPAEAAAAFEAALAVVGNEAERGHLRRRRDAARARSAQS